MRKKIPDEISEGFSELFFSIFKMVPGEVSDDSTRKILEEFLEKFLREYLEETLKKFPNEFLEEFLKWSSWKKLWEI